MLKMELEKYIGKYVEIKMFDNHIIRGELHKTGEEMFKDDPNLYLPYNYYFLVSPYSYLFRSSYVKKLVELERKEYETYIEEAKDKLNLPEEEIIVKICPNDVNIKHKKYDTYTCKLAFGGKKTGCRGITCKECWNEKIKKEN